MIESDPKPKKKRRTKHTKGQGTVFQDPRSPNYQLSYWNGWRQVRESARTQSYNEACETLKRKLTEVSIGKAAGAERIHIAALLQLVIDDYRRNEKADSHETEQRIHRLLMPAFGKLRAVEFTTQALNNYIAERQKAGRKPATINRELAHLRRAFNLGHQNDPPLVQRVPYIRALDESKNVRTGFLTEDKYHAVLNELTDELKPVFVVAFHLGMRSGELLALKRSWVDISEGLIHIDGKVVKNKSGRKAPIYGDMRKCLEDLLRRGQLETPRCPWLFSRNGKQIRNFRADWERACAAAEVPTLLFHDLRRTAIRNMVRAGVPEKLAMRISGHKTRSVFDRYDITTEQDIKEAGKRTGEYLEGRRKEQRAEIPTEYFGTVSL